MPASVGLVNAVRDELRAEIRVVEHGLNSKIDTVEHRLNSKIDTVEHSLSAKIEEVSSTVQKVLVSVHRSQVLMEEQRGENRIVLDVFERQDRIEKDFGDLRGTVHALSAGAKR